MHWARLKLLTSVLSPVSPEPHLD